MRVGIPFALWAFCDTGREILPLGCDAQPWRRSQIDTLRHHLGSDTNLEEALDGVWNSGELDMYANPVILVLSDGKPTRISHVKSRINSLTAKGIPCVGLGIGSGTGDLLKLFPHSLVNMLPGQTATRLAQVLRAAILQNTRWLAA